MGERPLCVVQARMGSSRLPGKVLAEVGGRPMLALLLARLRRLDAKVVVATSDRPGDDPVASCAHEMGVGVFRGDEHDVLGRFLGALDAHPSDTVVRITGDCPLTDPDIVTAVLALHRERDADYTSNVMPRTFPKGLDVEVCRADALRVAAVEASAGPEREHVTPYLYRHPERFRLANLRSGEDLGDENWTVDTVDDLETVRGLVALVADPVEAGWRDLLTRAGRRFHPPRGQVHLRPAFPQDRDRILTWRNEPDTVRFSLTGESVAPDEHARWFAARLDDPATRLWIAEVDGTPVGSVRVDVADAAGTVSIALDPTRRGRGLGVATLRRLVEVTSRDVGVTRLLAAVLPANEASLRAFVAAGFVVVDESGGPVQLLWENPAR